MRLAYVCADPGVPVFGRKGASVHVQELIRAFRAAGVGVELLATRRGGRAPSDLQDLPLHPLPRVADGEPAVRERSALGANTGLRRALDALDAAAGGIDLVYERYSLHSHAAMSWARERGVPGVLEVNAPLVDEHARHRGLADRDAAEAVAARVLRTATAVVAVSDQVARWVVPRAQRADHVHVVPNGVRPTRFPPRPPAVAAPTCTVGFVGTLKPWHGVDVLVDAVAELLSTDRSWRLLLVGDGPERRAIEAAIATRGLVGAVELTGAVDPAEVPELLTRVDIAVAPYPAAAGLYFSPLKVVEYLAAGLPVVASRTGQVADLLSDGVDGVLVPPGDARALARALRELRDDPARRTALGRAGRALAGRRTWDDAARRILAVAGDPPVRAGVA